MRRKDPAIGAHHSATWSVMFLLTTDASNAGTKEDTMRPFLVVIPELSSNSLLDIHKVVRDLPLNKRTESDWRQIVDALEAELERRKLLFEPIEWE